MPGPSTCDAWRPSECEGTPACPPRCPRYVDDAGRAVLIEPREPPLDALHDGTEAPDVAALGARADFDGERLLVATCEDAIQGYAHLGALDAGTATARVETLPDREGGALPVELARQAIAHAIADGAGRLLVAGDVEPFAAAGPDLVEMPSGGLAVPLTDPAATALTTPPGRDRGDGGGGPEARPNPSAVTPDPAGEAGPDEQTSDDGENGAVVPGESPPGPPGGASADLPGVDVSRAAERTVGDPPDLSGLFGPGVVAVVGASDREGSIGRLLLENLAGYRGTVVPVTTRAETVFGEPAAPSLAAVPAVADVERVDLAIVALPPAAAISAVEDAVECGVEHVVVVSAGFEEAGGEALARRLRAVAAAGDLTLVGPNSMGVASTATGLNATFGPRDPPRGSISLISQSGALVTAAIAAAVDRGLGFRHVVSVGNKAGVDEVDLLRYFGADPGTDVIAAYLEDFEDGEDFVEVARQVTRSTPVVVLKAGRTAAGAAAAASHTGSLATDDTAVDAAFDRAGVLRADSAEQLLDVTAALGSPLPAGDAVGVVTNAGGPGVLTTDAVSSEGLDLASFADETRETLAELLPATAAAGNPVDVLGDADVDRFAAAVDAVLGDPNVDVGVTVTTPHPLVDHADLVAAVGRAALARNTPVVTSLMDGDLEADTKRALRRYGVPNYPDPTRAGAALAARYRDAQYRERPPVSPPPLDLDLDRVRAVLDRASAAGRNRLGVESLSLLEACGIDVPDWRLAESAAAVPEAAEAVAAAGDGTVVLKVASPDVVHKVDVGGVRVGVEPAAAGAAAEALLAEVREARPEARIDGVVVQATVDVDEGVETVVGATDSPFGHLVAVGLGGTLIEETADVAFELAPLDARVASRLIDATAVGSVLSGVRGRAPADRDALVDALLRVAALVEAVPAIAEFDLNPLIVTPEGAVAVDLAVELASGD